MNLSLAAREERWIRGLGDVDDDRWAMMAAVTRAMGG